MPKTTEDQAVETQPKTTRGDKAKPRANKKVLLSTAAAIAVVVATPVAYTKWWVPQQDQRIYAQVQEDVSGLIENSYTGAIYESVTSDQLKDISKDISRIHSDSLRTEVESKTKSILDQVQVQTRAKETLAKVQAAKTYAERKAQARTTCCNAVRWWRGHPGLNEDSESSQLQWHRLLPLQRLHPLQAMLVFLGLKTSFFSIYATDAATIIPTTIYCSITESLR